MLWGMASVYCKRVDILWPLLNNMTYMLHSEGHEDEDPRGGCGGGCWRATDVSPELEKLVAAVPKNLDIKGDDAM